MSEGVYVAAPYGDASRVQLIHERLRAVGLRVTSTWADEARGPETRDPSILRRAWFDNHAAIVHSSAVLVLARDGAGQEMFAEAAHGLVLRKAVVWHGSRRTPTSHHPDVAHVETIDEAIRRLLRSVR